ncbi:MAG: chitobiase/beta-hexosaminidase C-terminal domain-containing protein [Bacteroidetes bacterium]|nr:chitobiase/beta-hexosaminidase C-terminal domain-containing protein [Bacteroidota bacterium]MCL1969687.1 chitobiase/beta-hexosaminidase C-terminal domain-containing protein [Bacteroidota bacterium]
MKKNYDLKIFALLLMMILGISNALFAQISLPFQSDFSGVGGSSQSSSASMPAITAATMPEGFLFTGSEKIYEGGQKLKFGTASLTGTLPTDVINTNGASTIEVKFNAIAWPQGSTARPALIELHYGEQVTEILIDGRVGWPLENSELIEFTCQFTAISTPTSLFFKTTANTSTNESRIFLDNVRIIDAGSSSQVSNPTFTPAGGVYNTPQNVTINCATEGATIHYTTDGSTPTTSSAIFSAPIVVSTTTTIKALAVKNGMDPSSVTSATYTFPQTINTLAALRALAPPYNNGSNPGTDIYIYTGQAVITQKKISTATNKAVTIYIQDETAAIMIYDQAKNLQEDLVIGDKISNVTGTLTNYYGMIEIIPAEPCTLINVGQQIETTVITAAQLDGNYNNPIQAKVVTLKDVMYVQTGAFEKDKYYDLKENNIVYDSVVYIESLFDTDYIGDAIPAIVVKIDGVVNFKGSKDIQTSNRIVPLDKSNHIIKPEQGINDINKSVIKLTPNPANSFVNIITGSPMKLEIYSLIGKLITTEYLYEGSNIISVSGYPAGLYLIKLKDTNTGQTFVQKLVVK